MRRFLIGFGACAALVVLLLVGVVGYVAVIGNGLDTEAKSFAESSVTAITGHWKSPILLARATDTLKQNLSAAKTATIFDLFGKLGPLMSNHGCKGQATFFRSLTGQPSKAVAGYVCTATYQNGDATINLALEKHANAWSINGFHVNSDIFLPKKSATTL